MESEQQFSPMDFNYCHILSWNVRGIGVNQMDQFLRKFKLKQPWEILLLQEAIYTRKIQPYIYNTCDGHRVFAMTPQVGQRSCAIIVQADLSNSILENSFQQHGRACKLDFLLGNKYYRFICAHLWAKTGTAQYSNSLSDIEFLLNLHGPSNIEPVIGADIQENLFLQCRPFS